MQDGPVTPRPTGDAPASHTELKRDPSPSPLPRDARFTPGVVLADRYRIVALLGRGGMGEVFRAEDLKLGQQVALKFLPASVAGHREALARLYSEVRLGRQISHPNVCRIYDIAEAEGHHFIAMEYIDGEDLASLLRRIGRLPHDKALDIARDICTGLAAAHGLGVVHRDLKPANIMIDGRGEGRITDFGLAALSDDLEGRHEIAGTPAYMAPEQIEKGEVTHKTDLYSLGLVLYEIFTGKRLFEGETVGEVTSRRRTSSSQNLSRETSELDPSVQRVILRCLEDDPKNRPASIHSVIAALPGGDPLQAAIDAGETPSPEMIAAAGDTGELRPAIAWPLLAVAILLVIASAILGAKSRLTTFVPLPNSPEILAFKSRELVANLTPAGGQDRTTAGWFEMDESYFQWDQRARNFDSLQSVRPALLAFVFRQSPREMIPRRMRGQVTLADPDFNIPGMARVVIDPAGNLIELGYVPPQQSTEVAPGPIEWSRFIDAAGLEEALLEPVAPEWSPPLGADRQFAWRGTYPGQPDVPIRVEAASLRGTPVWFEIFPPWREPIAPAPREGSSLNKISVAIYLSILAITITTAAILARRNLRRKRGDRKGAWVVGVAAFAVVLGRDLFGMEHVLSPSQFFIVLQKISTAIGYGFTFWVFYVALEPYLRRSWPRVLIGWARLVGGRAFDPRVGREVLLGVIVGMMVMVTFLSIFPLSQQFGPALPPVLMDARALSSFAEVVEHVFSSFEVGVRLPFLVALLLLLTHALLRNRTAAVIVSILLLAGMAGTPGENLPIELPVRVIVSALLALLLVRVGLIASVVAYGTLALPTLALNFDPSSWFFLPSVFVMAIPIALAAWGFWASLGTQPVFAAAVLEE